MVLTDGMVTSSSTLRSDFSAKLFGIGETWGLSPATTRPYNLNATEAAHLPSTWITTDRAADEQHTMPISRRLTWSRMKHLFAANLENVAKMAVSYVIRSRTCLISISIKTDLEHIELLVRTLTEIYCFMIAVRRVLWMSMAAISGHVGQQVVPGAPRSIRCV